MSTDANAVFVYATMRSHAVQRQAVGKVLKGVAALLPDYVEQLLVWDGDHYPTLKVSKGDVVKGEVVHVDTKTLKAMDQWEHLYARKTVKTTAGDAWVYIFRHG